MTGDVAVLDAGSWPMLGGFEEAVLSPHATIAGSLRADSVRLHSKAEVTGDVGYDQLFER